MNGNSRRDWCGCRIQVESLVEASSEAVATPARIEGRLSDWLKGKTSRFCLLGRCILPLWIREARAGICHSANPVRQRYASLVYSSLRILSLSLSLSISCSWYSFSAHRFTVSPANGHVVTSHGARQRLAPSYRLVSRYLAGSVFHPIAIPCNLALFRKMTTKAKTSRSREILVCRRLSKMNFANSGQT